ncbi:hypothetical protein Bcav_0155 [Beutenbergia cavernae DSM 12333]|uniref:SnoaL-like domain-containing protein n=1 Tax=Beutenbergia cavernae (strain ATCC BAA-8 / DSM 12333 / CCUG 43141 / JCM 11478 / NBRC 16432 / NCIMB 13614 / HKI 0122) TaxID=471853 RepID=C5BVI0_BEUC1|nr:nuclear transport factor 2 family protein [Beutenbergia cavernae]ACQ78420.1 hypothetical protein Bcav_0155 [Beutenbergia cavernae DSM 12333]
MTDAVTDAPTQQTAEAEVTAVVVAMYRALGDRAAFDAHLHPEITIWESDADALLHGLTALDELRDVRRERGADGPAPTSVGPEEIRADVWGDVAVVRYLLRATFPAPTADERFRVTDVLRREQTWRIVHHHAEKLA